MPKTHSDIQKAITTINYYLNLVGEKEMLRQIAEGRLPDTIKARLNLLLNYGKNLK